MKKKQKLKKLVLKKEEIVNLNDMEMKNVMGGGTFTATSSNPCWAVGSYITGKIVDYIIDTANDYFNKPKYESKTSDVVAYGGCLLPDVVVTP